MFKGVNVYVYVGEGLRRSFAMPDPFVLTNKICLNQSINLLKGHMKNTLRLAVAYKVLIKPGSADICPNNGGISGT